MTIEDDHIYYNNCYIENGFIYCQKCSMQVSQYLDFEPEIVRGKTEARFVTRRKPQSSIKKVIDSLEIQVDSYVFREVERLFDDITQKKTMRGNGAVKRSLIAACYFYYLRLEENKEKVRKLFNVTPNQFNKSLKKVENYVIAMEELTA